MACHDVGIAFDHDDAMRARDLLLREVQTVQHLCLLVDRRLGGVEVLGPLVVVVEAPRAEPDRLPGDVANRPDDPAAEAIVAAALTLRQDAGSEELLVGEP
jgi:hypothetical protein